MTSKITLSMIVKNEAGRYLRQVLKNHLPYIDEAVIIDDGSTDDTADVCKEILHDIPLHLIQNETSQFANEVILRKQQWEETVKTNPEWILNLDADEMLEEKFVHQVEDIHQQQIYDAIYFRLYDMWNETHYREDNFWKAHHFYRPFMIRYRDDLEYTWKETAQHCGRFPIEVYQFSYFCHPARIKHLGWASPKDRKKKYDRYMELDPEGKFGWKEQYDSILDEQPYLIPWEA
ncbi:glycosyltransferase family 2 protein [Shimazuella sp. AN120528]|uniref:glycosyltransferase n=1 Tax=Shimazuella soli TaxID=1892854 RepID=UPI001F0E2859|nr:glycosyltransferase [Shimazuella soli]MCH5586716.1 glycosyltransferase family 2 protein [Shimazuella soli]